jgi:DNA transposition AAA+ family ATPase
MKSVFLETGNVRAFREALATVEDMEKGQPGLVVVGGRAGRGKTVCAREYAVRTGAVYLRVMQDWTPRAMLAQLCREINGTEPRSVERCKIVACEELERMPRTILVDEADRLNVGLVEHFRDIHDLAGAPVVLIGEEFLIATLSTRRRLWSRVTRSIEFGPVSAEDIILFGLRAAEIKIDPQAAQRIATRCSGDFRLVWLDMKDLERICRANQTDRVDLKMLEQLPARKPGVKPVKAKNGNGGGR